MQCIRCGMTMKQDKEYCSFCGEKQVKIVDNIEEDHPLMGLGGWLTLFQLRIYLQLALTLQILWLSTLLEGWVVWAVGILSLPYIYTLTLFYRRHMRFRAVYTITVAVYSLALIIMAMLDRVPLWIPIANLMLDGMMLGALYASKRVRHTFIKRTVK